MSDNSKDYRLVTDPRGTYLYLNVHGFKAAMRSGQLNANASGKTLYLMHAHGGGVLKTFHPKCGSKVLGGRVVRG